MKKSLTLVYSLLLIGLALPLLATFLWAQTTVVNVPADPFSGHNIKARTGQVPGVSVAMSLGHSDGVSTTLRTLYHGAGTGELSLDTLIATPATVAVASTDVDDDANGTATGALAVQLSGLNSNLAEITENVVLDGQTEVVTTSQWYVVTKVQVISAGSSGANEGTVWVGAVGSFTAGVPATKFNAVEAGTNVSATAVTAVPAGKRFYVNQFSLASGDTTKVLNFQFKQYSAAAGLWYETYDIHGKQDFLTQNVVAYPSLGPGDVAIIRCKVNNGTALITASLAGVFIDGI